MDRNVDRLVAAELAVFVGALAAVYRLDDPALWIGWAVVTVLVTGATLVWLNT